MICVYLKGFNHSVWNTLVDFDPAWRNHFLSLWRIEALLCEKSAYYYYFDAKHNDSQLLKDEGGDFGPHYSRYSDLAKLLILLSTGIIAFLVNTLANAKDPIPKYCGSN